MTQCDLKIQNSVFEHNFASDKGGAIYYGYKRPVMTNLGFMNNSALYGPNIASYAVKIRFNGSYYDSMVVDNIGPNIFHKKQLSFALMDYDNQTILTNSENEITLVSPHNISSIIGINTVLLEKGVATFDGIAAVAPIGAKNQVFHVSSRGINRVKIAQIFGSQISENNLILNFRNCQPGEYIFDKIR
jgi:predicted outer membrane repeat protein